jgi:hypothetical protein
MNTDTVTVSITIRDETFTASIPFKAGGMDDEKHVGRAVAAVIEAIAATHYTLRLGDMYAHIVTAAHAPLILESAGQAYHHFDVDDRDGWALLIDEKAAAGGMDVPRRNTTIVPDIPDLSEWKRDKGGDA